MTTAIATPETPACITNYSRLLDAERRGIQVLNYTAAGWWVGREMEVGGFYVVRPNGRTCTCGEQGVCVHRLVVGWYTATDAERTALLARVEAALVAGREAAEQPVSFEGAEHSDQPAPRPEPADAIELLSSHPSIQSGACLGCRVNPIAYAFVRAWFAEASYTHGVCADCADQQIRRGALDHRAVATPPVEAAAAPEPEGPRYPSGFVPIIRNLRRGLYQCQSETRPDVFYNVFMLGQTGSCTCKGRFHRSCKHRRACRILWDAALAAEETARQEAAHAVVKEPFDDGWQPVAAQFHSSAH